MKGSKGLKEMVLAGALALGMGGCDFDERKDFVVQEGRFTCASAKLIYQQMPSASDSYRLECMDKNGNLVFRTGVVNREFQPTIFCLDGKKCVTLYSQETKPEKNLGIERSK